MNYHYRIEFGDSRMKTRSIIMVFTLILAGGMVALAQETGVTQIKLTLDGETFGGTLVPPTGQAQNYTWTLPAQSGTIALSSTGGWLVGGQGLLPTNPGLLGSTDAADVSLIAGGLGNVRMTLLSGSSAVLLPTQTELRLGDAAGGQYSALKSPPAITPDGTNAGSITYVYPTTGPGGTDVRMKVKNITVSGNDRIVEFDWTNPNTTGQIGFKATGGTTCDDGSDPNGTGWYDVAGGSFVVNPSSIYSFEMYLDVPSGDVEITWGTQGGLVADPAGVSIIYKGFELTANGNNPGGTAVNTRVINGGEVTLIKGYIETTAGTPANSVVQLLMQANVGAAPYCISNKSSVQLVTE